MNDEKEREKHQRVASENPNLFIVKLDTQILGWRSLKFNRQNRREFKEDLQMTDACICAMT